jgi:hypothetical protein
MSLPRLLTLKSSFNKHYAVRVESASAGVVTVQPALSAPDVDPFLALSIILSDFLHEPTNTDVMFLCLSIHTVTRVRMNS